MLENWPFPGSDFRGARSEKDVHAVVLRHGPFYFSIKQKNPGRAAKEHGVPRGEKTSYPTVALGRRIEFQTRIRQSFRTGYRDQTESDKGCGCRNSGEQQ